ncbi:MAG: redoxin domain-containing protein [Nocardioidaceae bacterium]|nr:redoxin domain-containing protein [Nocardioidaceae bacterium]
MRPHQLVITAGLIVSAALAGCGNDSGQPATAADVPSAASSAEQPATTDVPDQGDGSGDDDQGDDRGSDDDGDDGQGTDDAEPTAVPEVLDFEATEVSGEGFAGADLAGTDTVFWFWAPWCTECAAAAPGVQAAAEATGDVNFVGVAGLSSDVAAMEGFVDQHGLEFPQLADSDGSVYTRFGVTQQDTYVFVSAEGEVETISGYSTDEDPQAVVDEAFG